MSERDAEYTADQPAADPARRLTDADIAWYRAEHTPDLVKAHDGSEAMECAWCEDSPWPCSIIDMVNEVVELRIDLTKTRRERDTTRRANGEMAAVWCEDQERIQLLERERDQFRSALEEADQALNGDDPDYRLVGAAEIVRAALSPSAAGLVEGLRDE